MLKTIWKRGPQASWRRYPIYIGLICFHGKGSFIVKQCARRLSRPLHARWQEVCSFWQAHCWNGLVHICTLSKQIQPSEWTKRACFSSLQFLIPIAAIAARLQGLQKVCDAWQPMAWPIHGQIRWKRGHIGNQFIQYFSQVTCGWIYLVSGIAHAFPDHIGGFLWHWRPVNRSQESRRCSCLSRRWVPMIGRHWVSQFLPIPGHGHSCGRGWKIRLHAFYWYVRIKLRHPAVCHLLFVCLTWAVGVTCLLPKEPK